MIKPNVAILKTDGINCDMEMAHAFEVAGAKSELVHINELRGKEKTLRDFAVLAIPGGFSYGDDIASGAVLANELMTQLSDDVREFIHKEKPIIGICNGFQVLTRAGILPDISPEYHEKVSLLANKECKFISKWVELEVPENAKCEFVKGINAEKGSVPMHISHAEGRFFASGEELQKLQDMRQVAFKYVVNPNGSSGDIAGICDYTGLVLGMMPHPERSVAGFHADRSRTTTARNAANIIFKNIVNYAKES